MKRCNYVELFDQLHHTLSEKEKNKYMLAEIAGEITFCESTPKGLIIKLKDQPKNEEIIWSLESEQPIPAICGQVLRCFYEKTHKGGDNVTRIEMDAYELMTKKSLRSAVKYSVVRRGIKSCAKYKFIESN